MNAHDREQAMDAELERLAEAHVLLGRESLKREQELQQQVQLAERGADLARQAREQDRMESTAREQALQAEVDRLKDELAAPGPIPYSVRQSYERLIAQARLDGLREGFQGGLAEDGPQMLSQSDFEAWFETRFAALIASKERP